MAEVGIHVHRDLEAPVVGDLESLQDRAAQPAAAAAAEQVHPRIPRRRGQHDVGRAVGRVVVDHEQLQVGRHREHPVDQGGDVLPLVVGGRLHEHAAGGPVVPRSEILVAGNG